MKKIYKVIILLPLGILISNPVLAKDTNDKDTNDNEDTGQSCDEVFEKQSQHKTKTNPKYITVYE